MWRTLAEQALSPAGITSEAAHSILNAPEDDLLGVLDGAFMLRRRFHGRDVRLHVLQNAKSGACPEDCAFCSQSGRYNTGIEKYRMQTVDELVDGARKAHAMGAVKYCMVTATRGPSARDLEVICEATRRIKAEMNINICTSLGLLQEGQAEALKAAGVTRFNHNLEGSRRFFPEIVSSHGFDDRVATVKRARAAGLEACCGGIMGMGETVDDRVSLAFELRSLEVESIPINFLDPRPGTPLGHNPRMSPVECLKTLAMFRYVNPSRDIRVAGGREVNLRSLGPLALWAANSIFVNGYLTTGGAGFEADRKMIEDAGFVVAELIAEGEESAKSEVRSAGCV